MAKSNATKCREYRQRKKEENKVKKIKKIKKIKIKKFAKVSTNQVSTNRVRRFRARRKALLNVQQNIPIASTSQNSENDYHDSKVDVLDVQGDVSIGHNIDNNNCDSQAGVQLEIPFSQFHRNQLETTSMNNKIFPTNDLVEHRSQSTSTNSYNLLKINPNPNFITNSNDMFPAMGQPGMVSVIGTNFQSGFKRRPNAGQMQFTISSLADGGDISSATTETNTATATIQPENENIPDLKIKKNKKSKKRRLKSISKNVLLKALGIIEAPDDEYQVFGNYVASEFQVLSQEENKLLLRRKIQNAILEVAELDSNARINSLNPYHF